MISMGLFGRHQRAGVTITADELYRVIHEILVSKAPSLAPTVTPYGVMVLYLPTTALVLNLSGKHWSIGVFGTENYPTLTQRKTVPTPFGPGESRRGRGGQGLRHGELRYSHGLTIGAVDPGQ